MYNNFYLQDKRVEEHLQDLQREANQQRIVANLPRDRRSVGSTWSVDSVHSWWRLARGWSASSSMTKKLLRPIDNAIHI